MEREKTPVDIYLIENPQILSTHAERAARQAWAEAEKQKRERIELALHWMNAGDYAHAIEILKGAIK